MELIDLGDRLALLVDMPGSGRASGLRLTQKYAWVVTLKDGVVIRVQEFLDHAEALEAVGLKE